MQCQCVCVCFWVCVDVSRCLARCCHCSSGQLRLKLKQTTFSSERKKKKKHQLFLFPARLCATSETPLTCSHLFNPLFLHLFLSFFLSPPPSDCVAFIPFLSCFPPFFPLLWVRVGERRTGGNWCNEFRALMLAEASLPWLLVAINLPHSVRAKCAHNRQRGSSNWLPITRLWIKDMERGGRAQYGSAVTFILTLRASQER